MAKTYIGYDEGGRPFDVKAEIQACKQVAPVQAAILKKTMTTW